MRRIQAFYLLILCGVPGLLFSGAAAAETDNVAFLHSWYRSTVRERFSRDFPLRKYLFCGLWPLILLGTVIYLVIVNGPTIRKRSGRGLMAQGVDQVRLAMRHCVPPPWYYIFELFRPEMVARVDEFLLRHELKPDGIYSRLRRYSGSRGDRTLSDKLRFHEFCRENGLRAAAIYCEVGADGARWQQSVSALPQQDLFVKPRALRGGRGAQRWLWRDGRYFGGNGASYDGPGLLRHLGASAHGQSYLVQERLVNHPDTLGLTAGALSTVRVLICANEEGEPEVVHAYMRMNCDPSSVVDNVHAGGIAAPVELESGRLGQATNFGLSAMLGRIDDHPVTGNRITGHQVPFWQETRDMACSAHRALGIFIVAGWDMAILSDGPCLVEGNHAPCVDSTQRMLQRPIGNSRFGQLLAFHLRRAQEGAVLWSPDRKSPASLRGKDLPGGIVEGLA